MIKRWKRGLVSTLALALGGVLLHAVLAGGAVAQDKVRVGMSAFQDVNSLYVGIEQGFYPGIEFEIQRSSWQGANELLVANQVDIATSSDSDVTIHNARGVETTLAFPLYYFAGGGLMYDTEKHDWKSFDQFMEESGGDIEGSITKALQQTVGATVGVSAAAAEFSAFVEMLNIAGLTTESYNIVELVQEDLPPALFSGSIDIMIAGIPQRLAALRQGYGTLMDQTVVPSTVAQAGFAAHRSWVEENFELAKRIQQGIFKTLAFIEDNPEEGFATISAKLLEAGTEVSTEALMGVWNTMEFFPRDKATFEAWVVAEDGRFYWRDRFQTVRDNFIQEGRIESMDTPLEDLHWGLRVVDAL